MKRLFSAIALSVGLLSPLWAKTPTTPTTPSSTTPPSSATTHTTIPTLGAHVETQLTTTHGKIALNFQKAPLLEVIHMMSVYMGHTFLIDPKLDGTLTVVSGQPISKKAAYQLFAQALQQQGFSLIEQQGYTAIVPQANAKSNAIYPAKTTQAQTAAKLVFLATLEARTVADLIRAIMPNYSTIVPYTNNNSLLITDSLPHLHDIIRLISALEAGQAGISSITLRYSVLPDIEPFVHKLSETTNKDETRFLNVRIVPDEANNRFFLMGGNTKMQAAVAQQIRSLDLAHADQHNTFHVLYLRNSFATQIAQVLGDLLSPTNSKNSMSNAHPAAATTAHAYQQSTSPSPTLPSTGASNAGLGSSTNSNTDTSTSTQMMSTNNSTEQQTTVIIPGAVIEADPSINALVIRTSDAYYKRLLPIIRQLDVRRAQVFIEALIVEVNSTHLQDIGIQWQMLTGLGGSKLTPFAGSVYPGGNNLFRAMQNPSNLGPGMIAGLVNGSISLPGIGQIANIGLLGQFLASSNQANILSTPNLLTLDNQEAEIVVGQNVPFVTGQYANNNGNTAPFQTIERHDVGLRLHISPHIMENGNIRLSLYQEVSSVMPNTDSSNRSVDIITNKRAMQTTVRVHDGQIIALGGLIEDKLQNQVDKVPILGDIPLIGALFRHTHQERVKTNLMIFLRPRIIYDREDMSHLSVDRYHLIDALKTTENREDTRKTHFNDIISPETLGWSLQPLRFPRIKKTPRKEAIALNLTPPEHASTNEALNYQTLNP